MTVSELFELLRHVPADANVSFGDEALYVNSGAEPDWVIYEDGGLSDIRPIYGCATRDEHEAHQGMLRMMAAPRGTFRMPVSFG